MYTSTYAINIQYIHEYNGQENLHYWGKNRKKYYIYPNH